MQELEQALIEYTRSTKWNARTGELVDHLQRILENQSIAEFVKILVEGQRNGTLPIFSSILYSETTSPVRFDLY